MKSLITAVCLASVSGANAALVSYYSFDTQNAADSSGSGNNGTLVGGATFSATEKPAALTGSTHSLALDGTDGRVNVPHSSSLSFSGGVVTVSMWLRSSAGDTGEYLRVISKSNGPGFELQRAVATNNASLRIDTPVTDGNNQQKSLGGIWNGGWHHVVFTLNNGASSIWVDGVKSTSTYLGTNISNTSALVIGDTDEENPREFGGWLDDVAIWDHAISDADVAGLYAGTLSPLGVIPEVSSFALSMIGATMLLRRRRMA